MDEITLSHTEFRALSSDTRTGIIKLLDERKYTLSEISKKMELAAPTVKQHLSVLEQADLISCIDEGRKWKYYTLTRKGKRIVHHETPGNVFIVLALSIVGMAVVLYALNGMTGMQAGSPLMSEKMVNTLEGERMEQPTITSGMDAAKEAEADETQNIVVLYKQQPLDTTPLLMIAAIFAAITIVLLASVIRKPRLR